MHINCSAKEFFREITKLSGNFLQKLRKNKKNVFGSIDFLDGWVIMNINKLS